MASQRQRTRTIAALLFVLLSTRPAVSQEVPQPVDPQEGKNGDIQFEYIECDVSWDEHCEVIKEIVAPSGFQICKYLYTIAYAGGHYYSFHVRSLGPNGSGGFTKYQVKLFAQGSRTFYDQLGAKVRIENVGASVIYSRYTLAERKAMGCLTGPASGNWVQILP